MTPPMRSDDELGGREREGFRPHDHKGLSEEKCIRCGWVMGHRPLNCNNDNTPHIFPSQLDPAVADVIAELEPYRSQVLRSFGGGETARA